MDREEMTATINSAVKSALDEKLGQFFIEREQHYLDHVFVKDVRDATSKIRGVACSVVTKAGITGLITLICYGIFEWFRRGGVKQ